MVVSDFKKILKLPKNFWCADAPKEVWEYNGKLDCRLIFSRVEGQLCLVLLLWKLI